MKKITQAISPHSFIRLIGGDQLVPHNEIMQLIQLAGAGIIAYALNASTVDSVPTKLFEYLGFQLPIILIRHNPWIALCQPHHAAIVFDSDNIDANFLLKALKTQEFYTTKPTDVFWESEQQKLIGQVNTLLN